MKRIWDPPSSSIPALPFERVDGSIPQPLVGFEKSFDLIHLWSALHLISTPGFSAQHLPTLSRYFESLSVSKGSLSSRYLRCNEDKYTLTIWNMLAYFNHCLKVFSSTYPDYLAHIKSQLVDAFKRDLSQLRSIYNCELMREQKDYLLNRIGELNRGKRGGRGATIEVRNANRVHMHLVKKHEEEKETIKRREGSLALHQPKRAIQALHEYEHLRIACACIQAIEEVPTEGCTSESMVQALITLRECFKMVMKESVLGIDHSCSLEPFVQHITKLRHFLEHPEGFYFRSDYTCPERQ